jgi:xylulokinase
MTSEPASGKWVLVIDLGTGGPKVGLVDQRGRVAACTSAPVKIFFLPQGGAEHDPAEWWSAIKSCAKEVLRASGVRPTEVIAVAVTSFWSVTVPVDERGAPLMNASSWLDTRGSPYISNLVKGFPNVEGYQLFTLLRYLNKHGWAPSPTQGLAHMLFIKHERPEVYARTYKFLEPMDYINLRLTGKFAATQNTVLPMMVCNNNTLDTTEYDPWLLKMASIDPDKLPNLMPIEGILGNLTPDVAQELGLSPDTIVICGVNDNASSAIGAGSIGDAEPAAVMGNSGHMAFHLRSKSSDMAHAVTTIPSALKDRYLFWADLGNNGTVLDTSLKTLLYDSDHLEPGAVPPAVFERADRIAAPVPPGSGGVIFLPWFNGSVSPHLDEHLRGAYINLSHNVGRGHLVRAVYEGLAMNWRWLRGPAEKLAGRTFKYWRLTGGGALSDVWAQIMADVVGIPMHRQANPRHSNVIGMGLLAFQRLGMVALNDIPDMIQFDRVFEPDAKNHNLYNEIYGQFGAARDRITPVMHVLNKPS